MILQTESSECGLACLAMIASHFGHHTDLADLRRQFSISLKGATLAQLMRHASAMHLNSRPLRLELDEIAELAFDLAQNNGSLNSGSCGLLQL